MAQKPIVHMHKIGEKIPFDISLYRSIEFSLKRPSDIRTARLGLEYAVTAVLAPDYKVDNPVTHARGVIKIEENATEGERVLLDEMKGLRDKVSELERMIAIASEGGGCVLRDGAEGIVRQSAALFPAARSLGIRQKTKPLLKSSCRAAPSTFD